MQGVLNFLIRLEQISQPPTKTKTVTRTFVPLSPEAIALGKKAYLGPKSTKRRKALQTARRNRKHS